MVFQRKCPCIDRVLTQVRLSHLLSEGVSLKGSLESLCFATLVREFAHPLEVTYVTVVTQRKFVRITDSQGPRDLVRLVERRPHIVALRVIVSVMTGYCHPQGCFWFCNMESGEAVL